MNNDNKEKRKLQMAILMIAEEIAVLCDKHHIPYFINSGTQLGAIRHGGFIPWDDDFDIGMRRSDYVKFMQVCEKELDKKKYFIQTEKTEQKYPFYFGKIQLRNTVIVEEFSKNVPIQHGIFVDIFPYDNIPDKVICRKMFLIKNHLIKNLLWIKCGFGESKHKSKFSYKVLKLFTFFFTIEQLKDFRSKMLHKYNGMSTKQCISSDYPKEQLMNSWFNNLIQYSFEGRKFWGFEDYDAYLKHLYGDYMTLPPESERITHTQLSVDFGPYNEVLEEKLKWE